MILYKDDVIIYTRGNKAPGYTEGEPMRTVAKPVTIKGFEGYSFFVDRRIIAADCDECDDHLEAFWVVTEAISGHMLAVEDTHSEALAKAEEVLARQGQKGLDAAIQKVLERFGPLPSISLDIPA